MKNANWVIKTWRGNSSYLWCARCWRHFQALTMEQHAAKLESPSSFNSKRQTQFHSNCTRSGMLEQQNSWLEKKSWARLGNLKLLLQLWEWDQNRCHKMQDAVSQDREGGDRLWGFSSLGWGIKKEWFFKSLIFISFIWLRIVISSSYRCIIHIAHLCCIMRKQIGGCKCVVT